MMDGMRNVKAVWCVAVVFSVCTVALASPLDRGVVALGTDVYVLNDAGGVEHSIVGGFASITDVAVLANGNIAVSEDANGGTIYVYTSDLSTQVAVNAGYGSSIEMQALTDGSLAVIANGPSNATIYVASPTLATEQQLFWGGGSHIGRAGANEYLIVTSSNPVYRMNRTNLLDYVGINFGLELDVASLANGDFLVGETTSGGYVSRRTTDYGDAGTITGFGTVSAMGELSDGRLLIGTQEGDLWTRTANLGAVGVVNVGGVITGVATFSDGGFAVGLADGQLGLNTGAWTWIPLGSRIVAMDSFVIPEPATLVTLLAAGMFGVLARRNHRK